jgi:hypothetical protein
MKDFAKRQKEPQPLTLSSGGKTEGNIRQALLLSCYDVIVDFRRRLIQLSFAAFFFFLSLLTPGFPIFGLSVWCLQSRHS